MQFSMISVFIAALAASAAAQDATPISPAACTITHFVQPAFRATCTSYEATSTSTSYTACGGCELKTKYLGVGLPCRTWTTAYAVATETAMACKRGANGRM